mgnify:FL=1
MLERYKSRATLGECGRGSMQHWGVFVDYALGNGCFQCGRRVGGESFAGLGMDEHTIEEVYTMLGAKFLKQMNAFINTTTGGLLLAFVHSDDQKLVAYPSVGCGELRPMGFPLAGELIH